MICRSLIVVVVVRVAVITTMPEEGHEIIHAKLHVLHLVSRQRGRSKCSLFLLQLMEDLSSNLNLFRG